MYMRLQLQIQDRQIQHPKKKNQECHKPSCKPIMFRQPMNIANASPSHIEENYNLIEKQQN